MFAPASDPNADFRVLEITPRATDDELRQAYRRMSMKHHPDKVAHLGPEFQKSATEKFQRVNAAYARIKKTRGLP
jgi:DnaJ like chaperone protein